MRPFAFEKHIALFATAALVLALCLLVPHWAFAVADKALFDAPHAHNQAAGRLSISPEDYTLVRALRALEESDMGVRTSYDATAFSYTALSTQSKEERDVLLPRTIGYLNALSEAGALANATLQWLVEGIFPRQAINFTHGIDSRGFEYITCNFGMGTAPPYYIHLRVEMGTDLLVSADFALPADAPLAAMDEEAAAGFIQYLGLGMLDWQVTDRTREEMGEMMVTDPEGSPYFRDYRVIAGICEEAGLRLDCRLNVIESVWMSFSVMSERLLDELPPPSSSGAASVAALWESTVPG